MKRPTRTLVTLVAVAGLLAMTGCSSSGDSGQASGSGSSQSSAEGSNTSTAEGSESSGGQGSESSAAQNSETTTAQGSDTSTAEGSESSNAPSKGELKVASMLAYPPFNMTVDGKPAGFEIDMLKSISSALGYSGIKWTVSDFPGIIPNVASGKVDVGVTGITGWAKKGTSAYSVVKKRTEQVSFTRPYYIASAVLVTKDSSLTNIDQLKPDMKVAIEHSSQYYQWATDNLAPKGIQIVAAPQAALYSQLTAGTVDAVIDSNTSAAQALEKKPKLVIGDPIPATAGGFCMAVKKGNTELLNELNNALTNFIKDGSYAKLYKKYFPGTKVPDLPTNNFA